MEASMNGAKLKAGKVRPKALKRIKLIRRGGLTAG